LTTSKSLSDRFDCCLFNALASSTRSTRSIERRPWRSNISKYVAFGLYVSFAYIQCKLDVEPNIYASIHRAATYDSQPLPQSQVSTGRRDEPIVLTPTTDYDERRRLSYDLNVPLPWESDAESKKKPAITPRTTHNNKRDSLGYDLSDEFNDGAPSDGIRQTKPRLSLQDNTTSNHQVKSPTYIVPIEDLNSTAPLNFNQTIRKPKTSGDINHWLQDSSTTRIIAEETPNLDAIHEESIDNHDKRDTIESFDTRQHSIDGDYNGDDFDEDVESQ
jgi:hypothetical protein